MGDKIQQLKNALPSILTHLHHKQKTKTEWAGPCKWCGGEDRACVIFKNVAKGGFY